MIIYTPALCPIEFNTFKETFTPWLTYPSPMGYRKVNYETVEPVADAMHFLSDPLESDQLGVTVVRCKPGWRGMKHDHTANQHEEVYVLIDGEATVQIDGEDVEMQPGDAVWISPESTRQIRNGEGESAFVLVSAPSSIGAGQIEDTDDGWLLQGFIG